MPRRGAPDLLFPGAGKQSALRIEATQEGAPAIRVPVVPLQLVKSFTILRTKANAKPPVAVPQITGADTQSQLSVALGARFFHSCSRCLTRVNRAENNTVPRSCPQSSAYCVDGRTSLRPPYRAVASSAPGRLTKGFPWTEFGYFCIDFRSITDFGARA